jgi:hypothetical protein
MTGTDLSLIEGMLAANLDYGSLWTRCFALGGDTTVAELRDIVETITEPDDHQHNIIAQALNELFLDRGDDHPVAYRHLAEVERRHNWHNLPRHTAS